MDWLPPIALLLGALGSILAVYATRRGQKESASDAKLALAWDMSEKYTETITAENTNLRVRLNTCEDELVDVLKQLGECKDGRRQLEIQVELLKLQGGRGLRE